MNRMRQLMGAALLGLTSSTASFAQEAVQASQFENRNFLPFTEEAFARGLRYTTPHAPSNGVAWIGTGVALCDLDGDQDVDAALMGASTGRIGTFENSGTGFFDDRSNLHTLPKTPWPSGVVALDYDADGDLDLFFTQAGVGSILAENQGAFSFVDVAAAAGLDAPALSTGASAGDFDGDGWIDLHVPSYNFTDRVFHNQGDGTFLEVAASLGLDDASRGWQSTFFDMDWDGDADLYVSNDKKVAADTTMTNHLYENVGGTFVDVSAASGTDCNIYSMGIGVGDYDGNGYQDLYCTNLRYEPNYLFHNLGAGVFEEAHALAGVESFRSAWGAMFFDFDNDAHQDLYVCNIGEPNALYSHAGSYPSQDIASKLDVDDPDLSYVCAMGDIDDDGDLDFVVQNTTKAIRLYVNNEGQRRNWIKLRVVGEGANVFAIGAHVSIRIGNRWQHREILTGGNSFKAQHMLTVHFGAGTARVVDEVAVTWPGGRTRSFSNLATNQTWLLTPE